MGGLPLRPLDAAGVVLAVADALVLRGTLLFWLFFKELLFGVFLVSVLSLLLLLLTFLEDTQPS